MQHASKLLFHLSLFTVFAILSAGVGLISAAEAQVASATAESPAAATEEIPDFTDLKWFTSIPEATAAALKEGKPMLIHFTANWCGWCRKLEADTYSHPEVWAVLNDEVVVCRIDTDKNPDVARAFKVRGLPYLALTTSKGETVSALAGYAGPDEFMNGMVKMIRCVPRVPAYERAVAALDADAIAAASAELSEYLPDDPQFLNETAWNWLTGLQQFPHTALLFATRALASAPGDASIRDTLAYGQLVVGDFDNAIENYRLNLEENIADTHLNLATALMARNQEGDSEAAREVLMGYLATLWPDKAE